MSEINFSIGRDVRGNVVVNNRSTGLLGENEVHELLRVIDQFANQVSETKSNDLELLRVVEDVQAELRVPDGKPSRPRIKALLTRIRDLATGTTSSLFASTVVAQVPWIWSQ